jgi:regulator of protease activity HflC (stomatin/prohibitin superfamily)
MKKLPFSILMAIAIFSLAQCTRINPGYVGFKYSYGGSQKGMPVTSPAVGWVTYMPGFSTVVEFPTSVQHYVWTEQKTESSEANEEIVVPCKGGASFKMDVGFNYSVIADSASHIYFKYKTDDLSTITAGFLHTTVRNAMADVSGNLTMDSMLNNLPQFERDVRGVLKDSLGVLGFHLEQFGLVSAPRPADPNIQASINQKIKAKQDAETAQQQLSISIAEANKKIATARGDSASNVIEASGEAEAIKKKQSVMTAEYVEYIKWNKWNGQLPTTTMGGGSGILLQQK